MLNLCQLSNKIHVIESTDLSVPWTVCNYTENNLLIHISSTKVAQKSIPVYLHEKNIPCMCSNKQ